MARIKHPLDFEKPLVELEEELETLRDEIASGNESKKAEYEKLEAKANKVRFDLYGRLTPFQRVQLSRHFDRPFSLDYVDMIFNDFVEMKGDRAFRDDPAIVGGTARIGDIRVMIVGHQRGRTTQERLHRNFGMPQPEGYRKALRLFNMAEKFELPLITFIDTQGAFPGMEGEERGQAEAIATNLMAMAELTVPIICVVIGEGGSGGALALGVGDRILMMENACYSVITPEGCASILFHNESGKSPLEFAPQAAEMLKLTAPHLKEFGVIDRIIDEPLGGAHWNPKETAENLSVALINELGALGSLSVGELIENRYQKFRKIGVVQ